MNESFIFKVDKKMNKGAKFAIGITVAAIIIVVIAGIAYAIYSSNKDPSYLKGLYGWGKSIPVSSCATYQFPTGTLYGVVQPAEPSTDKNHVPGPSITPPNSCVYGDQLNLSELQHTCVVLREGPSPVNSCIKEDGSQAQLGETELFYSSDVCNNTPCPDKLVTVAVNSHPDLADPYCLSIINESTPGNIYTNLSMFPCDAAASKQFLYQEVYNIGTDYSIPSILTPITLINRQTGQCVRPGAFYGDIDSNDNYNPNYPSNSDGCLVTSNSYESYYLERTDCTDGNPTWFWLPSITFILNSTGETMTNPRQLVYLPPLLDAMSSLDVNISGPDFMNWLVGQAEVLVMAWTASGRPATTATLALQDECITRGWQVQVNDLYP